MLTVLCVPATSNASSILGAAVNRAMDARKTSIVLMTAFVWLGPVPIGVSITEIVRAHGFANQSVCAEGDVCIATADCDAGRACVDDARVTMSGCTRGGNQSA